ncbi:hypothetical protein ATG_18740 [Desulfurococcaceae archaeon AG1]|nr:hypothetical protein ATG_18740 [Desulfurococcaceae archaeon AG1]
MPVMSDKVAYTGLNIKPPVTLQMVLPKETILAAKSRLGSTVGTQTVDNVRWGLEVHVCPEDQPDCTTTQHALTVVVSSDRGNNRWLLTVYFEAFYVSPTASFQFELFRFGSESDVVVSINFTDTVIGITANGKSVINTDTFKRFSQIRTLKANSYFYDPSGAEITGYGSDVLVYNVTIVRGIDVGAIINTVIPLAAIVGVISILPRVLGRLRG